MSRAWLMAAVAALLPAAASAATPDQQYGFAEQLAQTGEPSFAILEFRRFIFLNPQDLRVPEARLAIARIYLQSEGGVVAARRDLEDVIRQHPRTPAATRARQLMALMDANRGDKYQPLVLFFAAASARDRGDTEGALGKLEQLIAQYPKSPLAADAMLMRAQILEALRSLDQAIAAYAELPTRAPTSPLVPRALLGQARAAEARDGASPHVAALYRQLVTRWPRTPEAAEAQQRLAALEQYVGNVPQTLLAQAKAAEARDGASPQVAALYRQLIARWPRTPEAAEARLRLAAFERRMDNIPRRFRRDDIRPFKVMRRGYLGQNDRYDVHIEVDDRLTKDQIEATIEDALLAHAGDRKVRTHSVRVEAYLPKGGRRVGNGSWAHDRRPEYEADDKRGGDVWRDILKDMLK